METETISTTEARKRLSCTSQTIRNLIKGGKLEAVQLENGRFLINLESLQAYQQNNGKKALVAKEAKQRPNNLPISRPIGSSNSSLVQQFRAFDDKYREIDRLERKKSQVWSDLLDLEALATAVYCRDADISEWAELSRLGVPQVTGLEVRTP